jgi:hypothetical protein
MIPGLVIKTKHTRTVAMISEVEPGVFVIEPMHFIRPDEARRQAQSLYGRPQRPAA